MPASLSCPVRPVSVGNVDSCPPRQIWPTGGFHLTGPMPARSGGADVCLHRKMRHHGVMDSNRLHVRARIELLPNNDGGRLAVLRGPVSYRPNHNFFDAPNGENVHRQHRLRRRTGACSGHDNGLRPYAANVARIETRVASGAAMAAPRRQAIGGLGHHPRDICGIVVWQLVVVPRRALIVRVCLENRRAGLPGGLTV